MLLVGLTFATLLAFFATLLIYQTTTAVTGSAAGARVIAVAVGFGPTLVRWPMGSFEFRLGVIPLGSYSKFCGRDDPYQPDAEATSTSIAFEDLPASSRACVMFSGPASVLLIGATLLTAATGVPGSEVIVDRTAAIRVEPSGVPDLSLTNRPATFQSQIDLCGNTFVEFFLRLFTLQSLEGWGGILSCFVTCGAAANASVGAWMSCFGTLCVFLGIQNLIPLGSLNGGHLVMLFYETFFGKPPERVLNAWFKIGILIVLFVCVVLISRDFVWAAGNLVR